MKVYCAGPLFTPYERAYMSKCGAALREVGIDAFVPHESFKLTLPPEAVRRLADRGLLEDEETDAQALSDRVRQLLRDGVVTREELGLPTGTSAKKVYDNDFGAIAASNAILAVVNGPEVDDGTACEIGIFYALMGRDPAKKGVVALHEDWRTQESPGEGKGLNGFVLGCLLEAGQVVHDLDKAVAVIARWRDELEGDA